ncbi:MAG: DUF362 domain-containing protein [Sphaerochaetaceae bacterium]|jgi:uncharacterized protein (DUF362 family)/Pyruvate/2-oxoacid:ferredoxin oxidoreductase delta subunit|nr:DUF362 domain-containing protein [Sphaerochaetaceae bacterium]HHU87886.1 DUF362 domain-containing protein [Spirochaetales bacterium]
MKRALVAIERCESYSSEEVREALVKICEAAALPSVEGKKVLLKPNILSDSPPERAVTTRSEVLRELIKLLWEKGASEIFVGDSPSISSSHFSPRTSGIAQVCQEEGATWVDFSKDPKTYPIPWSYGHKYPLAAIIDEVDIIISVAKLKTHQLMYATGAVKNMFGTVVGLHKSACHLRFVKRESFARMLSGLYSVVKPHFAIMDAIIAMEGPGPSAGSPRYTGLLLASNDPTALDAAQGIIMGYDPFTLPLTAELVKRKLTLWRNLDEIEYPLLKAEEVVVENFKRIEIQPKTNLFKALVIPFFTRYLKFYSQKREPKPLFDPLLCIGCGKCVKICPAQALTLTEEFKIDVDYKQCIRCYCCHEVCPVDAITIEGEG